MSTGKSGIIALLLLAIMLQIPSALADTTIVILRHGEKPDLGLGQLSCRGLNRSLALAPVLLSHYGKPAMIYAPNPAIKKADKGVAYTYIRPLATIEPLAIRVGMSVNLDWGMADIEQLADALLERTDGVQIVVWEHHLAEQLSKHLLSKLGGNPADVPVWQDDDFDSIYEVHVNVQGNAKHATFVHAQEGLNNQNDYCQ